MPVLDDSAHQAINRKPPGQSPGRKVVWKLLSYYAIFIILDVILYALYYTEKVSPLSDPWAYNATMGFLGGLFYSLFILYANKRYMLGISRFEDILSKCRSCHRAIRNAAVARIIDEHMRPSEEKPPAEAQKACQDAIAAELNGEAAQDLETLLSAAPLVLMNILDRETLHAKKTGELVNMKRLHGSGVHDTVLNKISPGGMGILNLELRGHMQAVPIHGLSSWVSLLDEVAMAMTHGAENSESEIYPELRQDIEGAMTAVHSMDSTEIPGLITFVLWFLNFFFLVSTSMTTYLQLSWYGLFLQLIIIIIFQTALFVANNLRDPLSERRSGLHRGARIEERVVKHIKENATISVIANRAAINAAARIFSAREPQAFAGIVKA